MKVTSSSGVSNSAADCDTVFIFASFLLLGGAVSSKHPDILVVASNPSMPLLDTLLFS
jgi:hypothetical protein